MKNKIFIIIIFIMILFPINTYSKSGCCSWHGGVAGCRNGRQVCKDGTLSPTCTCYSPSTTTNDYIQTNYVKTVYGCMDPTAKNYNPSANKQKSYSCTYYVLGCTDKNALNYNEKAEKDNGTCIYEIKGCTFFDSLNYNPNANTDDGSCIFKIYGCTNKTAGNYNKEANTDDGSCLTKKEGCTMPTAKNYDRYATHDDKSCIFKEYKYNYSEPNNNIANIIFFGLIISIIILILYLHIVSNIIIK